MKRIQCSGTHREMGIQQGRSIGDSIRSTFERFAHSPDISAATLGLLSFYRVVGTAGRLLRAAAGLFGDQTTHEWKERVEGIAEGCELDRHLLIGAQAAETLLAFPLAMSGCTTVGVEAGRSATGSPLLLKNYDIHEILRPSSVLRLSQPTGRIGTFELGIDVLAGSHLVMNEEGLCISYNYGMVNFLPRPGLPVSYLLQAAAERFTRTTQVVDWIRSRPSANPCILTVVDSHSDLCVIEKAGSHTAVRYPKDGLTVATNHFLTEGMKNLNYDRKVTFGRLAPAAGRGESIQTSNEVRLLRALGLLHETYKGRKIGQNELMEIASDHDGKQQGDMRTICRHHRAMMTLASIILSPADRKVFLCEGNPCKGNFTHLPII